MASSSHHRKRNLNNNRNPIVVPQSRDHRSFYEFPARVATQGQNDKAAASNNNNNNGYRVDRSEEYYRHDQHRKRQRREHEYEGSSSSSSSARPHRCGPPVSSSTSSSSSSSLSLSAHQRHKPSKHDYSKDSHEHKRRCSSPVSLDPSRRHRYRSPASLRLKRITSKPVLLSYLRDLGARDADSQLVSNEVKSFASTAVQHPTYSKRRQVLLTLSDFASLGAPPIPPVSTAVINAATAPLSAAVFDTALNVAESKSVVESTSPRIENTELLPAAVSSLVETDLKDSVDYTKNLIEESELTFPQRQDYHNFYMGRYMFVAGERIGPKEAPGMYKVCKFVGEGKFSTAVEAVDTKTGVSYCIKIVRAVRNYYKDGLREVKLLTLLKEADKNNICQCIHPYTSFTMNHRSWQHLCIVFATRGESLLSYFKSRRFQQQNACYSFPTWQLEVLCVTLCGAVALINLVLKAGHFDLKPENILVYGLSSGQTIETAKFEDICLIDMGLVTPLSSAPVRIGTLQYQPPDNLFQQVIHASHDMWSLGIVMIELLLGEPLFVSIDELNKDTATVGAIMAYQLLHFFPTCCIIERNTRSNIGPTTQESKLRSELNSFATTLNEEDTGLLKSMLIKRNCNLPVVQLPPLLKHYPLRRKNRFQSTNPYHYYDFWNFLTRCLQFDASKRLTAKEALSHPFFLHSCDDERNKILKHLSICTSSSIVL